MLTVNTDDHPNQYSSGSPLSLMDNKTGRLPNEVWIRVADFIDHADLKRLYSVNRIFFELALNKKYSEVVLDNFYFPQRFIDKVVHLKVPFVASRVRSLVIHPEALRIVITGTVEGSVVIPDSRKIFNADDVREYILENLTKCKNIETLTIDFTYGLESTEKVLVARQNLHAIWGRFSSMLKVLNLDMSLAPLSTVVQAVNRLECLEELNIRFGSAEISSGTWHDQMDMSEDETWNRVAAFINQHKATVRCLSISTGVGTVAHLDLSRLFSGLDFFPRLSRLHLWAAFDRKHISDPSGFQHFLLTHQHLQYFTLVPRLCCNRPLKSEVRLLSRDAWIEACFLENSLPNLHTLQLGANIARPGPYKDMLSRIAQLPGSLQSLQFIDGNMTQDDFRRALDPFVNGNGAKYLTKLFLSINELTPTFFDLIATTLPQLESLSLSYSNIRGVYGGGVTNFINEMRERKYESWKLRHISIRHTRGIYQQQWECLRAISSCIPNVR